MSKAKITIREVAQRAGVSVMTVSRVMRNEPQVAAATRQAVQDAIKALDYVPLQSARNLSSAVPKVLGLVVPHSSEDVPLKRGYEYLSALHLGVMQVCDERDYGLMLLHADGTPIVEKLVQRARSRQIGGCVLAAPVTETPGLFSALRQQGIVHASVSPLNLDMPAMWAAADEQAAVAELTLHLVARGHRAIAYVGGDMAARACRERRAGFDEACRRGGLQARDDWLLHTGITFEAGLEAGRRLLSQDWLPSAVQCETDEVAAGVIAAAHQQGMRLPRDLSVVGFDDFGLAHKLWPGLTTAHLPVEEMAAHAALQVIAALEGQTIDNRTFPCDLRLRESVAPVAA